MSALIVWLASIDPTALIGGGLAFVAFLLALPGLIVRLGSAERPESLSERDDRLDREAAAAVPDLDANLAARWVD